jgi:uncharacterized protein YbaP (TraB family)
MKKEHYPLNESIEKAFAESDALVVEADLSGPKMLESGMALLKKGMYEGEETLKNNISEKTYRLVAEKLKEMGMDIESYNKFKPWMLAMTIPGQQLLKMGFEPQYGIDMYFLNKAAGDKDILELEGVEFQVKLFESFSREDNENFLLSNILEADNIGKEVGKMIKAWRAGDVAGLERLMTEGIDKYPDLKNFYKKLADDRNEGMVKKIINYMNEGKKCFVVVGAAHMIGKMGIVQQLKDRGYTVTQL